MVVVVVVVVVVGVGMAANLVDVPKEMGRLLCMLSSDERSAVRLLRMPLAGQSSAGGGRLLRMLLRLRLQVHRRYCAMIVLQGAPEVASGI
jgi:hypothetical protein